MNAPSQSVKANPPTTSFGEALRTIGQGLQFLAIENFELQVEGDGYLALGTPRTSPAGIAGQPSTQCGIKVTLQNAWQLIADRISHHDAEAAKSNWLRVLFTPEGIQRLHSQGERRRREESGGVPNLGQPSQILRMVGEYIDGKSGRFISARKQPDSISFDYETMAGIRITKNWKLSEIHEYWLQLSHQRHERCYIFERGLAGHSGNPAGFQHR